MLRLCAIPHRFDAGILQVLSPALTAEGAGKVLDDFADLSIVLAEPGATTLALHDDVRDYLFARWLSDPQNPEFREASGRLARFFEERAAASDGVRKEDSERASMYHLVGVDADDGFARFVELMDRARSQFRHSECTALILLMREYSAILSEAQHSWLFYYEARVASDLRQWEKAEMLLQDLLERDLNTRLRLVASRRLGIAYAEQRKWQPAEKLLSSALRIAEESAADQDMADDITHDLGCIYRDTGRVHEAQQAFARAARLAQQQNDLNSLAIICNSQGTLHHRLGNYDGAIECFRMSLSHLEAGGDPFRSAQTFNNLGTTYAALANWKMGEEYLLRSLEVRRKAGDTRGIAVVLTNLAGVYRSLALRQQALSAAREAASLFLPIRDIHSAAQAIYNAGRIHIEMKQRPLAEQAFAESAALFDSVGDAQGAERARSAIALQDERDGWWKAAGVAAIILTLLAAILVIVVAVIES
jgi:tetratricopeptide (TPR) repeat protein